jgi:hypothetical protein
MKLQFVALAIFIFAGCFLSRFIWLFESDLTIYVTPMVNDLGTFSEKTSNPIVAKFRIHNGTNQTVAITRTMSSCGCTELDVAKDVLAARESTNLIMKIDPTRFHGQQTISAQIFTDNEAFPHFTVTAVGNFGKAESQEDIMINAPNMVVGQQVAWHHPLADSKVSIEWLKTVKPIPGMDLRIEEKLQGYVGKSVLLSGKVPTEKGQYEGVIQVKFVEYSEPTTIKLSFQAKDRLHIPEKLFAGSIRHGQTFALDFAIDDLLDERIHVSEVTIADSDVVDLAVQSLKGRTRVKVQFVPQKYNDGAFHSISTITVKDDSGLVQATRIPVDGWVIAQDSSSSSE